MSIETFGWITAAVWGSACFLAGWFGRERFEQHRRTLPRAMFTAPQPRLQLVQPYQVGPLGRHHVEVVTTHAMPVVEGGTS